MSMLITGFAWPSSYDLTAQICRAAIPTCLQFCRHPGYRGL